MIKRFLPVCERPISVVGLGCFAIGGYMWGVQDDGDSQAALEAGLAAGANWIDTAPLYGHGRAEQVVGRLLKALPLADRPLVATKFGHVVAADGSRHTRAGRAAVISDCEQSLRDLQVDCIDLFQLHWPAPEPVSETAAACAELLASGKVRAIGVSNVTVEQLEAWRGCGVTVASVQNPYSLFRRDDETTVIPWCAEHGVAYLAYSPLHRGLLFGTWGEDKVFAADDHRSQRPDFTQPRLGQLLAQVERLNALAAEHEMTLPELAVGALLSREGCTAVIVGVRNHDQGEAIEDLGMPLTTKLCDAVEAILAEPLPAV